MYLKTKLTAIIILIVCMNIFAADGSKHRKFVFFDNIDVEFVHNSIILSCDEGRYHEIEFTEKDELYIDRRFIDLNADQKLIVRDFRNEMKFIIEDVAEIGIEGTRIGLKGAKLGFNAVANLFKLASPYYDMEDLEEEIERESEKIEKEAEKLEELAEFLEDRVDALNELREEMNEEIPELEQVSWF